MSNQQAGRRSLLPQKTVNLQPLRTTKASSQDDRNELIQTHRGIHRGRDDLSPVALPSASYQPRPAKAREEDSEGPRVSKYGTKMQPPANIGRSMSLKTQIGRSDESFSAARTSSSTLNTTGLNSNIRRPVTLTTPRSSSRPEELIVENSESADRNSGERVEKSEQVLKTSSTRPNIAVPRHTKSSSQQIPSKFPSDAQFPASNHSTAKSSASELRRPAFSTLQQHFTPRKAPKATTASILAPSSSQCANDGTLTSEQSRLQMELMQLYVLHRSSSNVQAQWEQSAKVYFKRELQELSQQQYVIEKQERHAQAAKDFPALVNWSQSVSSADFAGRVHILSKTLQEICILLGSDSKYGRVISRFEQWFAHASDIRSSRASHDPDKTIDLEFIEDLGDGWTTEVAYLERKLYASSRELQKLGEPREGSSVARTISILRRTVASMLEELAFIKVIERDTVLLEARWVEDEVARTILKPGYEDAGDALHHHGIWHD